MTGGVPEQQERPGLYCRLLIRLVLVAAAVALLLTVGVQIIRLMLPFLAAWVVAWGLNRVASALQRRGQLAHKSVTMLLAVLLLLLLTALLIFLGWRFVTEAMALNESWQSIFQVFTDALSDFGAQIQPLSAEVQALLDQMLETAQAALSSLMDSLSASMLSWAGQQALRLPAVLLGVIVFIFATFLICADYAGLYESFRNTLDRSPDNPLQVVHHIVRGVFGDYLGRLLALCVLVLLVDVIGLMLLGVQYAALLSLVMAVLTFLPYTGSGTVLLPWAAACLLDGQPLFGLGLLLLYAVVTLVRVLFSRRFMKKQSDLERFVILICVFAGWWLWDWAGIILGPVIMIVVLSLYRGGFLNSTLADCAALLQDLARRMGVQAQPEAAEETAPADTGAASPGKGEEHGSDIH